MLSDVLDKTGLTARGLEQLVLDSLLERPWFKQVCDCTKKVVKFFDSECGFLCESFLASQLLDLPKAHKKDVIITTTFSNTLPCILKC